MNEANIAFCRKLFEKMKERDDYGRFIITDYFTLKTLDLMRGDDTTTIEKYAYAKLFREFGDSCKLKFEKWEYFFYALSNLLECREFYFVNPDENTIREYLKNLKEIAEEDWNEQENVNSNR